MKGLQDKVAVAMTADGLSRGSHPTSDLAVSRDPARLLLAAPEVVHRYVLGVADRVAGVCGADLVGVYTTGSLALGDFCPGRSDIDLMAVVDGAVGRRRCLELVRRLDHRRMPCPAAGLEFVLYPRGSVTTPSAEAGYLLNLNTGPELAPVASLDPSSTPAFWFVIDRAITWQSGEALRGPSPRELFPPPGWETLSPILITAVEAQRSGTIDLFDNLVLNACRALRYAEDRRWYSKVEAGRRTAATPDAFTPLVRAALETHGAGRRAGERLAAGDVHRFLDYVLDTLRGYSPRGLDGRTASVSRAAADAR